MKKYFSFLPLLTLIYFSCSTSKKSQQDCEEIAFYADNKDNDTSKILLLRTVVFDTTAILVHGYVMDRLTNKPISNAFIKLENGNMAFKDTTDSNGEFEIFENLFPGKHTLSISHTDYRCIIINDVVQFGGQWINFKLQKKD